MLKLLLHIVILSSTLCCFSQQKRKSTKHVFPLILTFQNQVDSQLLSLDSTYINPFGEAFTVRNFRYYISHLSFKSKSGKSWQMPETYFLIDERKPESKTISVQIPLADITGVQFSIGVDSSKNVSGVQTGALDPANGMFWTWNSGYIFAKLEGTSPQSKAPGHSFTYHIGGFRSGENAVQKIKLPVARQLSHRENIILVTANVNAWFSGRSSIKIADQPSTMQPGPLAMQIADNYSKMFSTANSK